MLSASFHAMSRNWPMSASESENGGMQHAESPEWMPASSICSKIPPM